jgi:hypothetical protein
MPLLIIERLDWYYHAGISTEAHVWDVLSAQLPYNMGLQQSAIVAQDPYAAPSHLVCEVSGQLTPVVFPLVCGRWGRCERRSCRTTSGSCSRWWRQGW